MKVPAQAHWIGSSHPFDLHEVYLNFRRDVTVERAPAHAALTITADSRYKLWINGVFIARGPSRCWPQAQQFDIIDVTRHLKTGSNAIAVQVYSPGYSHFAYAHRGACGLLAWLALDSEFVCVTDATWHVQRDRSWREDVLRISIYGASVERRDLRLEQAWQTAAPDGPDWNTPRVVAPAESPLWSNLTPRDVPLLRNESLNLDQAWRFKRGVLSNDTDPHLALRKTWHAGQIEPAPDPTKPVHLATGDCAMWAFDLGVSCVCHGSLQVSGAKGGERVLIGYAEKLRDGDLLISDPTTYCHMRPTDEFILRTGDQTVEPYSQRGGRYIIFAIEAPEEAELCLSFAAHRTLYPLAAIEEPLHLDPQLDRIAKMCRRTIESCLQDGFVDSVWRESSQWLGDCVAESFALAAISNDLRPLRRAITMAAQGAYNDGVLPSVLPGDVHAYTIVDYNFSWVELLDFYFKHPNAADRIEFTQHLTPVLQKMLDRFNRDLGEDGLIRSQPGRRFFLDWSPVDRREPSLTYNGRYLHALNLASTLARNIGSEASASQWESRALNLRQAMCGHFQKDDAWLENHHGVPASQLGLALLVLTGCMNSAAAGTFANAIVARSLDLDDGSSSGKLVLASPFMHHYVFLALNRLGRHDDVVQIIRARWGRWAEANEATTWENWDVDFPDGSRCHGFSAHPLGWLLMCSEAS